MKTFKLFSMAALALAMAACSNEDSALENAAPAQQQGAMKFTATLAAPGSGATTRTVYTEVTEGTNAGTINVAWKAGDEICITDDIYNSLGTVTVGTPAADGSAAISGTITGADGDNVLAFYPASAITDLVAFMAKYNAQDGTLDYIQDNLDLRMGTGTLSVNGEVATLADNLEMQSMIAIWKLTLQNSSSETLSATKVIVYLAGAPIASTTNISGTSTVYLALPITSVSSCSDVDINIVAIVGSDTYIYSKSGVTLARGKYYQSTVKMAKFTNLSTISGTEYTVQNGEVLTGTLASNVKISIADGATVTLKDMTINGENSSSYKWAGITCEGNATIILEGTNSVKGFDENYPGIYVPSGETLTIQGAGSLNASSNGWAAGIGGGNDASCGNITISGGTITAAGGESAAGIGGGYYGSCGNITISGGTVTAAGGESAAGIGGGCQNGTCGTITITSGVTKVTATKGNFAPNSIGAGEFGADITVSIAAGANVIQN